ncbi:WAS/WASL-interacting protein family member 1-like [Phocoena phocoena]|uniref:WAS/WASL-interacting protein family member 1-like n=1 Tax=Phocoena phocoena TaxID=9742 RepID=UPI003306B40C
MGAANSGRAAGGRVIRLVAGPRGGAAGAREGGKPPVKPNFWSKGKAAPLPLHIPLDPKSGLVGPRPVSTSPPTPHNAADSWASVPGVSRGNSTQAGPRHPQDPSQEILAGARPSAAISAVLSPTPPTPSRSSWALKAGGWAGPQAEAAAGAGGRAQELSEGRAPPPEPPSLPPTFPRPALPAHPSPRGPPPAARRPPPAARRRRSLRLQNNKASLPETPFQGPPPGGRAPAARPSQLAPALPARSLAEVLAGPALAAVLKLPALPPPPRSPGPAPPPPGAWGVAD